MTTKKKSKNTLKKIKKLPFSKTFFKKLVYIFLKNTIIEIMPRIYLFF